MSHADVVTGPKGERAHRALVEHSATFEPRLHRVTDRVHCMVGVGLANATLVVGDEGCVVIDTGDGLEEAAEHLAAFRGVTDLPIRAIVYTHFHYVDGTRAYVPDDGEAGVEIWAHARVPANMASRFGETGPHFARRVMIQFGAFLPHEGPDAMPNYGIGPYMFHPARMRGTPGYLPPTHTVDGPTDAVLAGVRFRFVPAASDSDDTLIIELPDEGVVVNNHVWPALYNIYTLRGGPYRDPLVLVDAIDAIRDMDPEHLVGVHGVPISGREQVRRLLTEYRDSIQLLWDQTVRGINRGWGPDELAQRVTLPAHLAEGQLTRPLYGLVPHHVRQIYNGLFGWFGDDPATLLPPAPRELAERTIDGFGGRERAVEMAERALADDEPAWAAHLGGLLLRLDPADGDARRVQAAALRLTGQRTTSANVRAFCLTRALELEGKIVSPTDVRLRAPEADVLRAPPGRFVAALRVQLDPVRGADVDRVLHFHFTDHDAHATLHVRRGVAEYRDRAPAAADLVIRTTLPVWARVFTGQLRLRAAVESGAIAIEGPLETLLETFRLFDDFRRE